MIEIHNLKLKRISTIQAGTYGNGDGKDMSHTKAGRIVKERASRNRARNRGRK